MQRSTLTLSILAGAALPVQEIAFALPHRAEFPFCVLVACALIWACLWCSSSSLRQAAAPDTVEIDNALLVSMLKVVATKHVQMHGKVTADDLHEAAAEAGITVPSPVFARVLGSRCFTKVGEVATRRRENHGRKIGVFAFAHSAA